MRFHIPLILGSLAAAAPLASQHHRRITVKDAEVYISAVVEQNSAGVVENGYMQRFSFFLGEMFVPAVPVITHNVTVDGTYGIAADKVECRMYYDEGRRPITGPFSVSHPVAWQTPMKLGAILCYVVY